MTFAARSARLTSIVTAAWMATQGAGIARADDARSQAARSFRVGSDAYARHDFRAAALSFDDAFRIAPRGAAAYNAGLAWESAGDRVRAADDYTRALETSDLGTVERADATGRLRGLERALARLSFNAPDGARLALDQIDVLDSSATTYVEPGPHTVRAQYRDGRTETRTVVAQAGTQLTVKLGEATEEPPPEPSRPAAVEAPPREVARRPPEQEKPKEKELARVPSPDRTPAWIALGGAVVASGVAIYLYERGLSALHDYENGKETSPALHTDATNYRTATWIAWGVAGALAATGVVLYVTAGHDASSPAVAIDGRGATLRVPF